MQTRKYRWSKVYESSEEELVALLERKHITTERWSLGDAEEAMPSRQIAAPTQLWCAEGQLTCKVDGTSYSLQAGDTLEMPAGSTWEAQARFGGCVCYESTQ